MSLTIGESCFDFSTTSQSGTLFNATGVSNFAASSTADIAEIKITSFGTIHGMYFDNIRVEGVAEGSISGLAGDFDNDNDVDIDDIDFYVGNIGASAVGALAQLDLNGDGQITAADVEIHVTTHVETSNGQTGTFLGDFNLDGTVDVLRDAFALVGSLGTSVSSYGDGDINLDGVVDVLRDAFALIGNLGRTNEP